MEVACSIMSGVGAVSEITDRLWVGYQAFIHP
jgi:hypothetical protein